MDVNITWFLANINTDNLTFKFRIDRSSKHCHTPRRNSDISAALTNFKSFSTWASSAQNYFSNQLFPTQKEHGLDLAKINDSGVFVPVVPLFDESKSIKAVEASKSKSASSGLVAIQTHYNTPILPIADCNAFLAEQKRSLEAKFADMKQMFPTVKIITVAEAILLVTLMHSKQIAQHYSDGVDYIEDMLRSQLIAAIGKEVTPVDFTNYMRFHNRQLFKPEYETRPFCYAIRRPDHYPEGTVSIVAQLSDGTLAEPIPSIVRSGPAVKPMEFSLDAATKVSFHGDRYLHAWVSHQFSGVSGTQLNLVAQARQFSSFILLVGRIASSTLFEPKYAIIVQNKDDLKIPLMLEQIPTPKEFRDAIESLSPEQQRFAKAFRSMQLASTLFGVCVIQIKPQLEKLLNLAPDALTKEIKLTQDLLELFIKYQIPSDLISFGGPQNSSPETKLQTVKGHVALMQQMITQSKARELEEKIQETQYAQPALAFSAPAPQPMYRSSSSSGGGAPGGPPRSASPRLSSMSSYSSAPPPMPSSSAPPPAPVLFSARSNAAAPTPVSAPSPKPAPVHSKPAPVTVPSSQPTPVTPKSSVGSSTTDITGLQDKSKEVDLIQNSEEVDYTKIPAMLDKKFEALDEDSALRPTIINPSETWTKSSQKALLASPTTETLHTSDLGKEKTKAFDLLDALSRSGALSIDHASLHVVLAATHCFDKSLMNTVIQDNINPIEKVERSTLIIATTIHNAPAEQLIKAEHTERVRTFSPMLFGTAPLALEDFKSEIVLDEKKETEKELQQ